MRNLLKLQTLLVATAALSAPAMATDFTWTGFQSAGWGTSQNWAPFGIPGAGDSVAFASPLHPTIELGSDRTVDAITIGGAVTQTLNGSSETLTVEDITVTEVGGTITHTINTDVVPQSGANWEVNGNERLTVTGDLSGTAGISKRGTGRLTLSGNNDGHTGNVTVFAGELRVSGGDGLSDSTNVAMQPDGTLRIVDAEQFGGFTGLGEVILGANADIGHNNNDAVFDGVISGSGGLIKNGDGKLTLGGDSSYSGGTTINAGNLTVGDGDTDGSIVGDVINNSELDIHTSGTVVLDGVISGSGPLTKLGTGTLELSGANTYTGGTLAKHSTLTDRPGTLLLTNTTGSATGTGDVVLELGGTIAGSGHSSGETRASTQAKVAPGTPSNPIGTLTLGGLTMDPIGTNAVVIIDLGGLTPGSEHDQLVVTNTADLGSSDANLRLAYSGDYTASPGDSFEIVTAGNITGVFENVNFPDSQDWAIIYGPDTIIVRVCAGPDCDNNGVPDNCDPDSDGDGVVDGCDQCPGFDDSIDSDGDGIADGCDPCEDSDTDSDGDGVSDACDTCPGFDNNIDCNNNGLPDACEVGWAGSVQSPRFNHGPDAAEYTFPDPPLASDAVLLSVGTSHDLFWNLEWGTVSIGGTQVGRVFQIGGPGGCRFGTDTLRVSSSVWNTARDTNGDVTIRVNYAHFGTPCSQIQTEFTVEFSANIDCDGDGVLNECEVDDCNGDGIPDNCQMEPQAYRVDVTGEATCDSAGPAVGSFNNVPPAVSDVRLAVQNWNHNVDEAGESLDLYANDVLLGTLFDDAVGCEATEVLTILPVEWDSIRAQRPGDRIEFLAVRNAASCAGEAPCFDGGLTIRADYTIDPDLNDNGWLDECDPDCNPNDTDSDGDGVPDNCDACPNTIADASIVDAYGCPIHVSEVDADGDGDVDADDYAALGVGIAGPGTSASNPTLDVQGDDDLDVVDVSVLQRVVRGSGVAADPALLVERLPLFRLIDDVTWRTWIEADAYAEGVFGTHMAVIDESLPVSAADQLAEMEALRSQDPNGGTWIGLNYSGCTEEYLDSSTECTQCLGAPSDWPEPLNEKRWYWSNGEIFDFQTELDCFADDPGSPDPQPDQLFFIGALPVGSCLWQPLNRYERLRTFLVQLPPSPVTPMPTATTETVNLYLDSDSDGLAVAGGATIDWTIAFDVSTGDNAGLALLVTDLVQDANNPESFDMPQANSVPAGMTNFAAPGGISNPPEGSATSGYQGVQRGTPGAMNLVQIGGGQNNLGAALPGGSVGQNAAAAGGVGQSGRRTLASGSFTAPSTPGTYVFRLDNVEANVFTAVNAAPGASPVVEPNLDLADNTITIIVVPGCVGDTDGDGDVDLSDLALLLSQFGMSGSDLAGDVDNDGDVDLSDLAFVLGRFGQAC